MRRLLREPLLCFALVGALLFAAETIRAQTGEVIVVDTATKDHLRALYLAQLGEDPDAQTLQALVNDWVHDQALYLEALRLGLDRDDSIVRRRLVQKMAFLAEGVVNEHPGEEALQSYYAANELRYRTTTSENSDLQGFAEVEQQVLNDYLRDERRRARKRFDAEIASRYEVVIDP